MRVDAIVLDVDGGAMLDACLASLEAQSVAFSRVIIFDNGSRTPVADRLSSALRPHIERSETNLGFTGGVNAAFRQVDAELVALINNDVVLDRDWLATLLAAMQREPRLAAVQTIIRAAGRDDEHVYGGHAPPPVPRTRDDDSANRRQARAPVLHGEMIDGAGIDISDGTFRQIGSGMPVGSPLPDAWGVSATAALYRVAALGERIFDPRFFAYYEDVELCARLHAHGWTTRVLPDVKATHRGSHSASLLGSRARRLRTRNRYLVAKWHPGVGRISALLWEDAKLLVRGRSSLRGIIEGLF